MTLKHLVRELLDHYDRVTPAGVCYLLRGIELPPTASEAEQTLDWLARNGFAKRYPDAGLGPEYTAARRESE